MEKPFPAYRGTEPYVFVCYAHRDADMVYSDLLELHRNGINLWYDEGISAGKSWRAEIATAIDGATKFLFFISDASLDSAHCLREIDFALNHDIEIIPVYVEECSLPGELELVLNRVQALFRNADSRYMEHLLGAMSRSVPTAPVRPKKKKPIIRSRLAIVALGVVILVLVAWMQKDFLFSRDKASPAGIIAPSAFDSYFQGLELVERWDKNDNLDRAVQLFRESVAADPGFALAFARLADALRIQYLLAGDETLLEEAMENIQEAVRLGPGLAPVQVALGRIHVRRGNIDLATAALERALSIDANDAIAHQAIASVYARLGRLDDAEASFQRALALNPERLSVHYAYANFLSDRGRFDEAAREWQTVIRIAPDHYAALVNFGSVLTETGRIPEAITMYQRAIEIRPTYMAYSNLGTAYSRAKLYPDAVEAYRRAIEIEDTDWLAWGNLAYVLSWMNETDPLVAETFERAIALAEAVREQNPRDPFIHSDLALYYAKTGQAELARQRLITAVALADDTAEIVAAAAEAYEIIGQRTQAMELVHRALVLGMSRRQLGRNPELSDLLLDPGMQPTL